MCENKVRHIICPREQKGLTLKFYEGVMIAQGSKISRLVLVS